MPRTCSFSLPRNIPDFCLKTSFPPCFRIFQDQGETYFSSTPPKKKTLDKTLTFFFDLSFFKSLTFFGGVFQKNKQQHDPPQKKQHEHIRPEPTKSPPRSWDHHSGPNGHRSPRKNLRMDAPRGSWDQWLGSVGHIPNISGQISIIPKPVFFGDFHIFSPPFKVIFG